MEIYIMCCCSRRWKLLHRPKGLEELKKNNQILLKYCDENGEDFDLNGSVESIAGVCNKERNVFGLMPHPERAVEVVLGSVDGIKMLEGFKD